jgi:hypothetical protein
MPYRPAGRGPAAPGYALGYATQIRRIHVADRTPVLHLSLVVFSISKSKVPGRSKLQGGKVSWAGEEPRTTSPLCEMKVEVWRACSELPAFNAGVH